MDRLTSDSDYLASKGVYERHLKQGYPRNIATERYLRLCEYERIGLTPEQLMEVDRLYLEKCEEVNHLVAELKKICNSCKYAYVDSGANLEKKM